jgi:hypothetical protein
LSTVLLFLLLFFLLLALSLLLVSPLALLLFSPQLLLALFRFRIYNESDRWMTFTTMPLPTVLFYIAAFLSLDVFSHLMPVPIILVPVLPLVPLPPVCVEFMVRHMMVMGWEV